MSRYIAVYGTLMRGFGAHRMMKDCTFVGVGTMKGTLYYSGFPYFISNSHEGNDCVCELYELPPSGTQELRGTLSRLDSYEGVPSHYTRELIGVSCNGIEYTAWVYEPNADSHKSIIDRCPVITSNCYRTHVGNRHV